MARIKWVDERLIAWARWRATPGGNGGLGYPKQSALARLTPSASRNEARVPVCDEECWQTNKAVESLSEGHKVLLTLYYVDGQGISWIKDKLRLSAAAVHARLEVIDKTLARIFTSKDQQ
jgi:hypothetical protein